jgi:hypothetical protein
MRYIPATLHRLVVERARDYCEYCGLAQAGQAATFHVDHVFPIAAGGKTVAENLALACVSCSLRKSAKQYAIDPVTDQVAPIFNPRTQEWREHFAWQGTHIVGLTATGRSTLAVNREILLAIRKQEAFFGRCPPPHWP